MGNELEVMRTADAAVSLRQYFTVLSWAVILAGATVTGAGFWFFGFAGYGLPGWVAAAAWALICILTTGFFWGFVALGGLVADHIANSWDSERDSLTL